VEEGTLDELRHLTRSTITIETEAENSHLAQLNGVHDFVQKGHLAQFAADNEAFDVILAEASKLGVKKFESIPPTLEDL
ncbi:ATP-binding protein DrrA1-3 family domain-containing protein, partial [Enterococcus faecalis]